MQEEEEQEGQGYNGWANYETLRVAKWLVTDPEAYELCRSQRDKGNYYRDVALELHSRGILTTTDNVAIWGPKLDLEALDAMIYDIP